MTMQDPTYRQILKLIKRIPDDILRPHANLKVILRQRTYNYFKQNEKEKSIESKDLTENIEEPHDQYHALQYLTENKYKLKFPLSERILHPPKDPNYYQRLIESIKPKPSISSIFSKWFGFK
ncbi:hypothetical protein T552_02111 [Pneumocystis carinii B80]|uniref:Uncharacterized protein n=1 Tax=Pneumocystis carinii (strain B80) TaxID=1408658 RepID=A0A0W4ZH25_PNEC8|nr:hypothetical protein T552_02111 [Pneumocystis carinii B80]KTW27671.1 hypothetical protein T552_02111 [Pneumocystis carinii B80]